MKGSIVQAPSQPPRDLLWMAASVQSDAASLASSEFMATTLSSASAAVSIALHNDSKADASPAQASRLCVECGCRSVVRGVIGEC